MSARIIDMNQDEQAVIHVRGARNIMLVFSNCTMDVFQLEGVVYTRMEYQPNALETFPVDDEKDSQEFVLTDDNVETQVMDEEDMELVATRYAGGSFDKVNEDHAARLEVIDLCSDTTDETEDEEEEYERGDTQLEYTQLDL